MTIRWTSGSRTLSRKAPNPAASRSIASAAPAAAWIEAGQEIGVDLLEDGLEDGRLGREAVVQGAGGYASRPGDVLDRGRSEPAGAE